MLGIEGSPQSLRSGGESSLESIADHLVGIAAIGFYGVADDSFLAGEGSLHGRRVSFPAFGASLYIGKEESDSARGQICHDKAPNRADLVGRLYHLPWTVLRGLCEIVSGYGGKPSHFDCLVAFTGVRLDVKYFTAPRLNTLHRSKRVSNTIRPALAQVCAAVDYWVRDILSKLNKHPVHEPGQGCVFQLEQGGHNVATPFYP